jgi:hypothetical protein
MSTVCIVGIGRGINKSYTRQIITVLHNAEVNGASGIIVIDECEVLDASLYGSITPSVSHAFVNTCKPEPLWKQERDYPTMKEGIRRNQIRRLKK